MCRRHGTHVFLFFLAIAVWLVFLGLTFSIHTLVLPVLTIDEHLSFLPLVLHASMQPVRRRSYSVLSVAYSISSTPIVSKFSIEPAKIVMLKWAPVYGRAYFWQRIGVSKSRWILVHLLLFTWALPYREIYECFQGAEPKMIHCRNPNHRGAAGRQFDNLWEARWYNVTCLSVDMVDGWAWELDLTRWRSWWFGATIRYKYL